MKKPKKEHLETSQENDASDPFAPKNDDVIEPFKPKEDGCTDSFEDSHRYGLTSMCKTEDRGCPTPHNQSSLDLVLNSPDGFIPLWKKNSVLNWRFNERSMSYFNNPEAGKLGIRKLLPEALRAWGDSLPIKFREVTNNWDFEIYMNSQDICDRNGACVLASAFFPDQGRHYLQIYPKMFSQIRKEQVDTLIHETGHMFGLRHFFANVSETAYPSEIFGTHKPFTIMNYGSNSELTAEDKSDLKNLYSSAWSGVLSAINGTPIAFVRPYHNLMS